jgi:hypothetical protein
MATFMVLNDEKWALTCAHVVEAVITAQKHSAERDEYLAKVAAIESDSSLSPGKKRHKIGQLTKNWQWITHNSTWWAADAIGFETIHVDPLLDIAAVKLTGNAPTIEVQGYPTFADPASPITPGTSLCRLGFPFFEVKTTFEQGTGQFRIENMPPSLAMFPNDGIFTRNMCVVDQNTKRQVNFIETSSPGLRGQSGGPIFDVNGHIWALQSRTIHLPLGFAPKVVLKGREITEHQFMHAGVGLYVKHIREFLASLNIKFRSA